jgi:hypothetical protein
MYNKCNCLFFEYYVNINIRVSEHLTFILLALECDIYASQYYPEDITEHT